MAKRTNFYLTRRLSLFIMLFLTFISVALSVIMVLMGNTIAAKSLYLLMIPGDELFPLTLFVSALIFRNRFLAVGAIFFSFCNIILRVCSIALYSETFLPLDYLSLKLLYMHTDYNSIKATIGEYFYLWLIPLFLAVFILLIYCSILTWDTVKKLPKKLSRRVLFISSFLLLFSSISNVVFQCVNFKESEHFFPGKPLPIAVGNIVQDSVEDILKSKEFQPIPLPQESRELLTDLGILAPETESPRKQDLFDRIIIIAMESFDYQFIRRNNKNMPEKLTPNLDRFSEQYPSMENYFTAAQPTSWGLNAIICSRLEYQNDKFIPNSESMFQAAKKQGFHTYYFAASSGLFEGNKKYYKQIFQPDTICFFEEFIEKYQYQKEHYWGLSDRALFDGVLKELKSGKENRFIAVVSTINSHKPYFCNSLSPEEEQLFPNQSNESIFNTDHDETAFIRALFSTDKEVGMFISNLKKDPALYNERTLIVITADHTSTQGVNYLKRQDYSPARIPLIFITPNQEIFRNLDRKKYASSIDLAPTLLNMINAEIPASFMGRDLFSKKNHAITMSRYPNLIIHSGEGTMFIQTAEPSGEDKLSKAFSDYLRAFYGE